MGIKKPSLAELPVPRSYLDSTLCTDEAIDSGTTWSATEVSEAYLYLCDAPILTIKSDVTLSPSGCVLYFQVRDSATDDWRTVATINLGTTSIAKTPIELPPLGNAIQARLSGTCSGVDASNYYTINATLGGFCR